MPLRYKPKLISKTVYVDRDELDEFLVKALSQARMEFREASDALKAKKNVRNAYRKGLASGKYKFIWDLRLQIN